MSHLQARKWTRERNTYIYIYIYIYNHGSWAKNKKWLDWRRPEANYRPARRQQSEQPQKDKPFHSSKWMPISNHTDVFVRTKIWSWIPKPRMIMLTRTRSKLMFRPLPVALVYPLSYRPGRNQSDHWTGELEAFPRTLIAKWIYCRGYESVHLHVFTAWIKLSMQYIPYIPLFE
jgi:hypothetical protein